MEVTLAQSTHVVCLPSFMSPEEVRCCQELAVEFRNRPGVNKPMPWEVLFLQANGFFKSRQPGLYQKLRDAVILADRQHWGLIGNGACNLRVAEFHSHTAPSKGLPDPHHHDQDSLVTIDVLLGEGKYEGGVFRTLESDGSFLEHPVVVGDALVFVSHKYHSVTPLVTGLRQVLVLEFWRGPEQTCNYRVEGVDYTPGSITLPSRVAADAAEWDIFDD
eukprot:TRINITY_DN101180_c0_g1_i1.p1 TRINITY_DN101180_c0_g1~~TRINITY_DN101180_c0_g1_i1.p1  ORF type:complete len:218 (+),score=32.61 TRINITY_DN101180_c0_g1_i1:96-749(+)